MTHLHHGFSDPEFLATAHEIILKNLADDGYDARAIESQEWSHHLGLTRPNLDGTLEFFYGPAICDQEGYQLDYLVVHRDSHRGRIILPVTDTPVSLAQRLLAALNNHLPD